MIDISQWRARIGLYCCQATSMPAIDYLCHSFGGTKSSIATIEPKLPLYFSLFLHILARQNSIHPICEVCMQYLFSICFSGNIGVNLLESAAVSFEVAIKAVIFNLVILLLLLSGDIELNPGPSVDDKPDISLLTEWLDPLVEWQIFGVFLPGIQYFMVKKIEQDKQGIDQQKLALYAKWLDVYPTARWRDVIAALEKKNEAALVKVIQEQIQGTSQSADAVKAYADIMRQQYKEQLIVAMDWPPRVGHDFFGRLSVVEKQGSSTQKEGSAWCLLRGKVDSIVASPGRELSISDVLRSTDKSSSLRVVIDGPPGIGKTTLCRKLLNMWSNGTLHQQYDLVLYCPLRNSKIATATTLTDLFVYKSNKLSEVIKWILDSEGKGLLIIFDGWDELSSELRQSSLPYDIIFRNQLQYSSVIVTSRSYASSSLTKIPGLSKHLQVIGLSSMEIVTVIIKTLQKNDELAMEVLECVLDKARAIPSDEDSKLAAKLIENLSVRVDVCSLCYIPLVCSMVILVYCKEGGQLPTTLTQLYENFILQTIRRHAERHGIDPLTLGSLLLLPSQLAKPFQEVCHIAYTNLVNNNLAFSSYELHEKSSFNEAIKNNYLGLMTSFTEYDEVKYQFLHLSVQEFLAAWWIAKHEEKTEEVFKTHFDDDHFRMCLRFVAGLTHLEHESYQQYFKQLDVECKRKPLTGFDNCQLSCFYQNPSIRLTRYNLLFHTTSPVFDNVPIILLLQLLYESQNVTLCKKLAQSITNQSLCLDEVSLSSFDLLCLGFFLKNSNATWNHCHLGRIHNKSLLVAGKNTLQTKCKILEVNSYSLCDELTQQLSQTLLLCDIQECYFKFQYGTYIPCLVLLSLLSLPQLKRLHIMMKDHQTREEEIDSSCYFKLEKCLEMNSTLEELMIENLDTIDVTDTFSSIIRGVTRNKAMTSLSLHALEVSKSCPQLPTGVIEQLLEKNRTLQALSLEIPIELLSSSLDVMEVNTPLTAINFHLNYYPLQSLLQHIKGLHCMALNRPCLPRLVFYSHPSLHTLILPLGTAETAIELFTILQANMTLKALSVDEYISSYEESIFTEIVGVSLQTMLIQNETLKYLQINAIRQVAIPSSFLSFLATGIRHNTSLQQLSLSISMYINKEEKTFFDVISQNKNVTEFEVYFCLKQQCFIQLRKQGELATPFFYEQVLPAVTKMIQSNTTIRLLTLGSAYVTFLFESNWTALLEHLYETIFNHPSLEYIAICMWNSHNDIMERIFRDKKTRLIDQHNKKQAHKPLPTICFK